MTSSSTHLVTINEGHTLVYIFPAVFTGLAAVVSFIFFIPLGLVLTAIVVLLSLVQTGLDYDPSTQSYRRYKALFGKKWGAWRQLDDPEKFELRISVERAYATNAFENVTSTTWYGRSGEIARSVTYDLTYANAAKHDIMFYEFQDYKIARQFAAQLAELDQQPVTNHVAIKLQENREKRMRRMSR